MTPLHGQDAVIVRVDSTQGSVPRESGTWMLVSAAHTWGTIGGGRLEFDAIEQARKLLSDAAPSRDEKMLQRYALGPSLGQCCGGVVNLSFERLSASGARTLEALQALQQADYSPVALFGGGHVGKALVKALAELPFNLTWVDSRDEIFPLDLPANVRAEHSSPVQAAVQDLKAGSAVLIMSFSHAEDLDIVAACLARQRLRGDLPFVGLIGSQTKWASFRQRLESRGFSSEEWAHLTCPIGLPGIRGKEPAVIAASVAAQLLLQRSQRLATPK
jgi:xanthine dehydrogenase accessory factor